MPAGITAIQTSRTWSLVSTCYGTPSSTAVDIEFDAKAWMEWVNHSAKPPRKDDPSHGKRARTLATEFSVLLVVANVAYRRKRLREMKQTLQCASNTRVRCGWILCCWPGIGLGNGWPCMYHENTVRMIVAQRVRRCGCTRGPWDLGIRNPWQVLP